MAQDTGLDQKLTQLLRLADEQVHLARVGLLEDGHILSFPHAGQRIRLSLPDAQRDYIQRVILKSHGFYERPLLAALEAEGVLPRGGTVYDVGANIGNHTVYFSAIMGAARVVSFEPQAFVHDTLCRNVALNGLTGVVTHRCILGAEAGQADVTGFKPLNSGGTTFAPSEAGAVEMRSLDGLVAEHGETRLDLLKIDVEGMEMQVFAGAEATLRDLRPAIWVELLEADGARAKATAFLAALGYSRKTLGPNDYLFTHG